jgi:hypothetical protein
MRPAERTLGVDLSTINGTTGVCRLAWAAGEIVVEELRCASGLSDDELVRSINDVRTRSPASGWVGIDAPFGFPRAFSRSVRNLAVGRLARARPTARPSFLQDPKANWNPISRRITDANVCERLGNLKLQGSDKGWSTWPLSSVTERITPTTVRCGELLGMLQPPLADLVKDRVVEAYPIAALRIWLQHSTAFGSLGMSGGESYKSSDDARRKVLLALQQASGWRLKLGHFREAFVRSDDAIDALVCALIARLASADPNASGPGSRGGLTTQERRIVTREGWIHLPPVGHRIRDL